MSMDLSCMIFYIYVKYKYTYRYEYVYMSISLLPPPSFLKLNTNFDITSL